MFHAVVNERSARLGPRGKFPHQPDMTGPHINHITLFGAARATFLVHKLLFEHLLSKPRRPEQSNRTSTSLRGISHAKPKRCPCFAGLVSFLRCLPTLLMMLRLYSLDSPTLRHTNPQSPAYCHHGTLSPPQLSAFSRRLSLTIINPE